MSTGRFDNFVLHLRVFLENFRARLIERFVGVKKQVVLFVKEIKAFPVEFVGSNWLEVPAKPIAVCFGFNPWKRQVVSAYLKEYRTAFVVGKAGFRRVLNDFVNKQPEGTEIVYVFWGAKRDRFLEAHLKVSGRNKSKIIRIEDGFLRSIGGGVLHTHPASLCVDSHGIYFDAKRESGIENILANYDFSSDAELMTRARRGVELMAAARLTKYYSLQPYGSGEGIKRGDRYAILVIGQVEDDASVLNGRTKIRRNNDLILQAVKEFPNADIYYRPHPDYMANIRNSNTSVDKLSGLCTIVPPDVALHELFVIVDHVYTMTSLAAFEALLWGLKVTCFGAPFYSGWGVTDDRSGVARRHRKLSREELFAAAYLIYPRYIHPWSDEFTNFEDIAGYMVCEVLKYENIFEPSEVWVLFEKCQPFADILPKPFSLLAYLKETGDFAAADRGRVADITQTDFRLVDYPINSHFLSRTSNYDALVEYSNFAISRLAEYPEVIASDPTLAESFFYALSQALLNSNGRVIGPLPDLAQYITKIPAKHKQFTAIVKNYVRCLSANLQYAEIETFLSKAAQVAEGGKNLLTSRQSVESLIREALAFDLSLGHYRDLCQVLRQKPTRSERDFYRRHQLVSVTAKAYLEQLESVFARPIDAFVNRIMYWVLLGELQAACQAWKELSVTFDLESAKGRKLPLKKRQTHLLSAAEFFIKNNRFDVAKQVVETFDLVAEPEARLIELQMARKSNDMSAFYRLYEKAPKGEERNEREMSVYARTLREAGMLERSRLLNEELFAKAKTLARRSSIREEIKKIDFLQKTSDILNSVPQPALPKGVVFLASQTCFNTLAMMTPALVELKKMGYAVVNLCAGMTEHQGTGLDYIDSFAGCIPLDLSKEKMFFEWEVDWPRQVVKANGVNFYQGFYERLSTFIRRYHVDINMPEARDSFFAYLKRSDTCLQVCEEIYKNVVSKGIPATLVTGNSHVAPFSVFRDFARSKKHPLLGFINCNVAYESYFSNLGSKFANTMCVTDMTLYPNIRAPFMARVDQFERWYEKNADNPEYLKKADDLINVNRVGSTSNDREKEITAFLIEQKALGKKIVCAFGKVPVDLNVPYDGGPAHTDMADWINHTVEVCGKSDNIVLLVKPHPHELRPEIALDLVQSFHDLITVPVGDNVCLLGHKDINGHALAPYLDLALLYNGSSGPELTAQGIPVVMTSHFGRHDYPVEMNYPESRQQYESFISSGKYPVPSDEIRKRAAFLICYLGTEEISILNRYSKRQLTNDKIGVPTWRMDFIEKFLREGDPKMALIARRIVEKFEMVH